MKKILYSVLWASLIVLNQANAITVIQPDCKLDGGNCTDPADVVIQRWVANLMTYLAIAAVIYGLYGGFNILTAGWDEEKVKKWKKILINALIWIVVIFAVGSIVRWVLGILN
jgi:hypothetical protein